MENTKAPKIKATEIEGQVEYSKKKRKFLKKDFKRIMRKIIDGLSKLPSTKDSRAETRG